MLLNENERIEDLGNGLKIIQDKTKFCYGTDAVVLSEFITAKPGEKLMDLCSGTGIIPILLSQKTKCIDFTALEIQKEMCDLISRSAKLNGIESKIKVICGDLKDVKSNFIAGEFDVVSVNPPYMRPNTGKINPDISVQIARHEIMCNLEDVICSASFLLKSGGKLYMVHRTERMADVFVLMRKYRIEPKRLTFVSANPESVPSLILVEGQKDRKSGLIVTKPRYVNL